METKADRLKSENKELVKNNKDLKIKLQEIETMKKTEFRLRNDNQKISSDLNDVIIARDEET
jgi:hypothetical protein